MFEYSSFIFKRFASKEKNKQKRNKKRKNKQTKAKLALANSNAKQLCSSVKQKRKTLGRGQIYHYAKRTILQKFLDIFVPY